MFQCQVSSNPVKEPHSRHQCITTLNIDKSKFANLSENIPLLFVSPENQSDRISKNIKILDKDAGSFSSRLNIDAQKYDDLLKQTGLSSKQKNDVLQALWAIIIAFVDLGFNVSPTEDAKKKIISGNN